jgi:hypothetical protein
LYGIRNVAAAQAARGIGELLNCTFDERESDYLGMYWLAWADGNDIRVVSQPDPDGEPLEDDFADYQTLVYVDGETDFAALPGTELEGGTLEVLRDGSA